MDMISNKDNPVQWALMVMSLDDARDHLAALTEQMAEEGGIEEQEFKVQLGHVYAHLNRCWNSRNLPNGIPDDKFAEMSQVLEDLELFG